MINDLYKLILAEFGLEAESIINQMLSGRSVDASIQFSMEDDNDK